MAKQNSCPTTALSYSLQSACEDRQLETFLTKNLEEFPPPVCGLILGCKVVSQQRWFSSPSPQTSCRGEHHVQLRENIVVRFFFFLKSPGLIGSWGVNPAVLSGLLQQLFLCGHSFTWTSQTSHSLQLLTRQTAVFNWTWLVSGNMLASTAVVTMLLSCFCLRHPVAGQVSATVTPLHVPE